ncbi:hypothetical protein [Saccharibacillus deserti]|uniref:hypothetical protein n=1 Tax=Saccharibacillus deserti TaxID=1634444 RepID=UPI001556FC56|nr:hypothetical protein [Saccharibacillus deserti]
MKKLFLLPTVLALAVVSACGKEEPVDSAPTAVSKTNEMEEGTGSLKEADSEKPTTTESAGASEEAASSTEKENALEGTEPIKDSGAASSVTETEEEPPQNEELNRQEMEDHEDEVAGDAPQSDDLIRAADGSMLPNIEWRTGDPDVSMPVRFGSTEAELILGQDSPNGVKVLLLFPSGSIARPLDLSGAEDSGAFDDYGELNTGYAIQAALHDFDGDGVDELVLAAGDSLIDEAVWVFSYTDVANVEKVDPMTQDLATGAQSYIVLDGNQLVAPYGSQGLVEIYKYVDKEFLQPAN